MPLDAQFCLKIQPNTTYFDLYSNFTPNTGKYRFAEVDFDCASIRELAKRIRLATATATQNCTPTSVYWRCFDKWPK